MFHQQPIEKNLFYRDENILAEERGGSSNYEGHYQCVEKRDEDGMKGRFRIKPHHSTHDKVEECLQKPFFDQLTVLLVERGFDLDESNDKRHDHRPQRVQERQDEDLEDVKLHVGE